MLFHSRILSHSRANHCQRTRAHRLHRRTCRPASTPPLSRRWSRGVQRWKQDPPLCGRSLPSRRSREPPDGLQYDKRTRAPITKTLRKYSELFYKSPAPRLLTTFCGFSPKCGEEEWNCPSADSQRCRYTVVTERAGSEGSPPLSRKCRYVLGAGPGPGRLQVGVGGWVSDYSAATCRGPYRPAVVSYAFLVDGYITPSLCDPPITG